MLEYIRTIPVLLLVLIAPVPLALAALGSDSKPNIDGIDAEGFQLINFNVEAERTPSRSAMMTGRYGITRWEITLAEMLSDSGYATGIFGKWPKRRGTRTQLSE